MTPPAVIHLFSGRSFRAHTWQHLEEGWLCEGLFYPAADHLIGHSVEHLFLEHAVESVEFLPVPAADEAGE